MRTQAIERHDHWRLISLPISHYCEKVRWGLERFCLPYEEDPHLLLFNRKVTQPLGGTSVPVLVTPQQIFTDSTTIMEFLNTFAPKGNTLYPQEEKHRRILGDLEQLFNDVLGPETRRWFYFYALEQADLLHHCWCDGIPDREAALYSRMLPKMKHLVRESLGISTHSAEHTLDKIYQVFEQVEYYLADGRPYLLGDSMTVADISLAALAAPIILPPEHPMAGRLSRPRLLPRSMIQDVLTCRTTLTGEFILRMYRQERHKILGNKTLGTRCDAVATPSL